jgi:two-component system chemotaxis response regulator CheB
MALRSRVKRLANHHSGRTSSPTAPGAPSRQSWRRPGASYAAVGIGASVGGPPALAAVLGDLPEEYALPVLIVQHTAPGFTESLVRWLNETVPIPVALAGQGQRLGPGAWLAPDGAHLRLDRTMCLSLDTRTERGPHRPSTDILFESLAAVVGEEAVGVVLTGMGHDGAQGVAAIRSAGGLTIAQDEETSAVFGMPAAAAEAGAELILPVQQVAPRLKTLRLARRT